ncbi:MAG TPA: NADH-ubiquinone oxidoreductase-F iron-sulfur binding region domain-containing protein, partial [Terriglobales bacterium]
HLVAEVAQLKLNARVIATGSLGWREAEPVIAIQMPGGPRVYYGNVTPAIASELLRSVVAGVQVRKDLALAVDSDSHDGIPSISTLPFYLKQNRVVTRKCGRIAAEDLQDAVAVGAYEGLNHTLTTESTAVLEQLEDALGKCVLGKWRVCQSSAAKDKYVVAKIADGGALSKDVYLLEGDPHSVLEGLLIAAYAVGANRAVVCVDRNDAVATRRLEIALEQMESAGLVGDGILGSNFKCAIELRDVQRGLGGEEDSILVNFLEGRHARASVPSPAERDLHERAVVESVEFFAKVSAVMRDPAQASAVRKSKILTIAGSAQRTGVIEVSEDTLVQDVVHEIAGGATSGCELKAVQIGAPVGGWVPTSNLQITLGCSLGSGSLVVADTQQCAIDLARHAAVAAHHASCGQCTFGREGTRQLMDVLTDLARGRAKDDDIELLTNLSDSMKLGSLCVNGRKAPDAVVTTLQHFRAEYEAHVNGKQCPTEVCEMK